MTDDDRHQAVHDYGTLYRFFFISIRHWILRQLKDGTIAYATRQHDLTCLVLTACSCHRPCTCQRSHALAHEGLPVPPAPCPLQDCVSRCLPYWHSTIAPAILRGERVLVSAHGNSLRGIVKHLEQLSDDVSTAETMKRINNLCVHATTRSAYSNRWREKCVACKVTTATWQCAKGC